MEFYETDSPSLVIKITKLAICWFDFLCVDFRMVGEDVIPPGLVINLLEMDVNSDVVLCADMIGLIN